MNSEMMIRFIGVTPVLVMICQMKGARNGRMPSTSVKSQ